MRSIVLILLVFSHVVVLGFTEDRPQPASAAARVEEPTQQWSEGVVPPVREVVGKSTISPAEKEEMRPQATEKEQKRAERLTAKLQSERFKAKLERAKEAQGLESATFEDIVVLAGAIVTVVGIISIIFNPITGVIVALLGLLTYILGMQAGGSINNIF